MREYDRRREAKPVIEEAEGQLEGRNALTEACAAVERLIRC